MTGAPRAAALGLLALSLVGSAGQRSTQSVLLGALLDSFLSAEGHAPRSCAEWLASPAFFVVPEDDGAGTTLSCRDLAEAPQTGGAGPGRFGLAEVAGEVRAYGPGGLAASRPADESGEAMRLGAVFGRFLAAVEADWRQRHAGEPNWGDLRRHGGNILLRETDHGLWAGSLGDRTLGGSLTVALRRLVSHRSGWVVDAQSGWLYEATESDGKWRLSPYPIAAP